MERNFANDLITKIRQLNSIFEKSTTEFLPLDALCKELSDIIECNIYVFTPDGLIIAYAIARKFVCPYSDANLFKNTLLPAYYETTVKGKRLRDGMRIFPAAPTQMSKSACSADATIPSIPSTPTMSNQPACC